MVTDRPESITILTYCFKIVPSTSDHQKSFLFPVKPLRSYKINPSSAKSIQLDPNRFTSYTIVLYHSKSYCWSYNYFCIVAHRSYSFCIASNRCKASWTVTNCLISKTLVQFVLLFNLNKIALSRTFQKSCKIVLDYSKWFKIVPGCPTFTSWVKYDKWMI